MKRFTLCMMVGVLILGVMSLSGAQSDTSKGNPSPATLPAAACQAIQQYVAKIDAARSMSDSAKRQETYTQAHKELESVVLRHKKSALADDAAQYAKLTGTGRQGRLNRPEARGACGQEAQGEGRAAATLRGITRRSLRCSRGYALRKTAFAVRHVAHLIPIRFQIYQLVAASSWGSHSLRTTQGRLITSLMRPPAL